MKSTSAKCRGSRGGKRPGAGRKRTLPQDVRRIMVQLSDETVRTLDGIAATEGVHRSDVVRRLIEDGIGDR